MATRRATRALSTRPRLDDSLFDVVCDLRFPLPLFCAGECLVAWEAGQVRRVRRRAGAIVSAAGRVETPTRGAAVLWSECGRQCAKEKQRGREETEELLEGA